jgi:hypothetical protein
MKKITFLLILISTWSISNGAIVVRDIPDFTFTTDASLDFDFNNDGTAEFTFSESGGTVGAMFNSDEINFVTYGTIDDGEGWDVIKSLTAYPNPTSDFVSFNQPEMIKSVAIYTITSQKLFESFDIQQSISLENFPKGTYLFTMETISGEQISKKVVKN